jgi:hypothetical protein
LVAGLPACDEQEEEEKEFRARSKPKGSGKNRVDYRFVVCGWAGQRFFAVEAGKAVDRP